MSDHSLATETDKYPSPSSISSSSLDKTSFFKTKLSEVHAFPRLMTVPACTGAGETYCRSLLLQGNGFPLWYPKPFLSPTAVYMQEGISIGDVGILDWEGSFKFYFNIFHAADDPIHTDIPPREFKHHPPLDASEITYIPDYFKPGTILASEGVSIKRHGTEPLDASFSTKEREGAVLVLPHGASREDITSTNRLHDYIQRNAHHWYQVVNRYSSDVIFPNGSLIIVTGCDKTKEYGNASVVRTSRSDIPDFHYTWRPKFDDPWRCAVDLESNWYQPPRLSLMRVKKNAPTYDGPKNQCVFIRTLRVSLNSYPWYKTMPVVLPTRPFVAFLLQELSPFQRFLDHVRVQRLPSATKTKFLNSFQFPEKRLFEPNVIIAQIILDQFPDAEMSLIDDSVWCPHVNGGLATPSNVSSLIERVMMSCEVLENNGLLTLVPKPTSGRSLEKGVQTNFLDTIFNLRINRSQYFFRRSRQRVHIAPIHKCFRIPKD